MYISPKQLKQNKKRKKKKRYHGEKKKERNIKKISIFIASHKIFQQRGVNALFPIRTENSIRRAIHKTASEASFCQLFLEFHRFSTEDVKKTRTDIQKKKKKTRRVKHNREKKVALSDINRAFVEGCDRTEYLLISRC